MSPPFTKSPNKRTRYDGWARGRGGQAVMECPLGTSVVVLVDFGNLSFTGTVACGPSGTDAARTRRAVRGVP